VSVPALWAVSTSVLAVAGLVILAAGARNRRRIRDAEWERIRRHIAGADEDLLDLPPELEPHITDQPEPRHRGEKP
jgi:hypothetical protein